MPDLTIDQLPPWGYLSTAYRGRGDVVPEPFAGDQDRYRRLVDQLVTDLSTTFWPRYDMPTRRWAGDARAHAIALGQTDLCLMARLAARLDDPVPGADGKPATVSHRFFFEEEDGFKISLHPADPKYPYCAWGESFSYYCDGLPAEVCQALSKGFDGPGVTESGGLCVALKVAMQRPRPYQLALLTGWTSHTYETAYTADTPSLVSGHSMQAALSGCHVFKENPQSMADPRLREAWARFIVDVGDRRVFAGVHYPSDSMASWFCALRALREFHGEASVPIRSYLWHAITTHSAVYAAVVERDRQPGSPYGGMLELLEREAA